MKEPRVPSRKGLLKKGINIAAYVPMPGCIDDQAFFHFWQIARRGWPIPPLVYGRTDANRNKAAHWLLQTDYTHIAMLDADHSHHHHDIVERLARWVVQDPERLVVGGLNFRRSAPYDPCIFKAGEDGKLRPPLTWDDGLLEVDSIGHGCILISRKVFEILDTPWWAYGYNHAERNIYPTEDMYFCQVCRQNGIKMYCDTTTTSPHHGLLFVDADAFKTFIRTRPELVEVDDAGNRTSVIIPSTGRPAQLRKSVDRLLETVNGHDVEVVCVIEHDQESVKALDGLPVTVISREEHKGPVYGWNEGAARATGALLVLGADDLYWSDKWLDKALVALANLGGSGMVGLSDGIAHGDQWAAHYMVSRDYARSAWGGVLVCPHYNHYYLDIEASKRAMADNRYAYAADSLVTHMHHTAFEDVEKDATYQRGNGYMEIDKAIFQERQAAGFPNDYEPVF